MHVKEALKSRVEIRNYSSKNIEDKIKKEILEAARLAPSGRNLQHWKFILVDKKEGIETLTKLSNTGNWIRRANFAIVVLTNPKYSFHELDAGRAITYMQLTAWEKQIGSCIYTSYKEKEMKEFLDIPKKYSISSVVGFGYPSRDIKGSKKRKPLSEIAYREKFGRSI